MIDLDFVEKLIRALDQSGVDHVEIERGGTRLRISKTPSTVVIPSAAEVASSPRSASAEHATSAASAETASEGEAGSTAPTAPPPGVTLVDVTSPMVGTFYRAPSPDSPSFTEVGKRIATGDTLCIIEAMKLMNELEAEVSGTIHEICVTNGEPVEYGQLLFRVEPD